MGEHADEKTATMSEQVAETNNDVKFLIGEHHTSMLFLATGLVILSLGVGLFAGILLTAYWYDSNIVSFWRSQYQNLYAQTHSTEALNVSLLVGPFQK